MNTSTIRKVAYYVGGAVVGALVGAVIGSLIVDQLIAAENDQFYSPEEIEGEEEEEEQGEEKPLLAPKATIDIKTLDKKRPVDYSSITRESKIEENKSIEQLSELAKKYKDEDSEERPVVEKKEKPIVKFVGPRIISVQEYSEPEGVARTYYKPTLTYYELDDVLADENEGIVTDIENSIGGDALLQFGNLSEDKDVVYVRNDKIATDFEIIRVHKSYAEDVVGIVDKKRRPKKVSKFDDDE